MRLTKSTCLPSSTTVWEASRKTVPDRVLRVWKLRKRERSMKIRYHFNTLLLLALLGAATAADGQVQPQLARRYFEEATKLCERDADGCGV